MAEATAPAAAPANGAVNGHTNGVAQAAAPSEARPAEVKPPSILDELDGVLKKHGGFKTKANGKEVALTDAKALERHLQRSFGAESRAEEVSKKEAEAQRVLEVLDRVRGAKSGRERAQLLASLAGDDEGAFREAAEEFLLERIERQKENEKLPPEARAEREARRRAEAELARLQQRDEEQRAQQEQAQFRRELSQTREMVTQLAVKALGDAKVSKEAAPLMMPALIQHMKKAQAAGLPLTPEEIAGEVTKAHDSMATGWLKSMEPTALLDKLTAVGLDKALARAIFERAQSQRGAVPGVRPAQPASVAQMVEQTQPKRLDASYWNKPNGPEAIKKR